MQDEYQLLSPSGRGSVTYYADCLPSELWLKGMYGDKCVLVKNGKKLKLEEALKEIRKNSATFKRSNK